VSLSSKQSLPWLLTKMMDLKKSVFCISDVSFPFVQLRATPRFYLRLQRYRRTELSRSYSHLRYRKIRVHSRSMRVILIVIELRSQSSLLFDQFCPSMRYGVVLDLWHWLSPPPQYAFLLRPPQEDDQLNYVRGTATPYIIRPPPPLPSFPFSRRVPPCGLFLTQPPRLPFK